MELSVPVRGIVGTTARNRTEYEFFYRQLGHSITDELLGLALQTLCQYLLKKFKIASKHLIKIDHNIITITQLSAEQLPHQLVTIISLLTLGLPLILPGAGYEILIGSEIERLTLTITRSLPRRMALSSAPSLEFSPAPQGWVRQFVQTPELTQREFTPPMRIANGQGIGPTVEEVLPMESLSNYIIPFVNLLEDLDKYDDKELVADIKTFIKRYLNDNDNLQRIKKIISVTSADELDCLKDGDSAIRKMLSEESCWCGVLILKYLDEIGSKLIREVPNYRKVYYRLLEKR